MTNNSNINQQALAEQTLSLKQLRLEISQLDNELIKLLATRRRLSRAIAINKQADLRPIRDQVRERELLNLLVEKGHVEGLEPHYVTQIFHAIIQNSVQLQKQYLQSESNPDETTAQLKSIAILGGQGSYSYLAANKYFSHIQKSYVACASFEQVINNVEEETVDYAVIPIENTTSGGITEVYDLLQHAKLCIIGEEKFPIKHCLVAAVESQLAEIKQIVAHPQASKQCSKTISNMTSSKLSLVESTAHALRLVCDDKTGQLAAIASEESALELDLKVLLPDITNLKENSTRFLILAKKPVIVSKQIDSKTSIALSTGQKPGALAEVLLVFKEANIPLSKLESRPIPENLWQQMFYLDIDANILDENTQSALKKVTQLCSFFKVLGCYPSDNINPTQISD